MSIIRRNQNEEQVAVAKRPFEPLRAMRDLLSWDPFQTVMPALFEPVDEQGFIPAFEIKETKESLQFSADVPGIKEADLVVEITGNRLIVRGKRDAVREDKGETFYAYERNYGSFQRAFTLPEGLDIDLVHAELKDGVLTIALPKKAIAQTKTVAVKVGAPKS